MSETPAAPAAEFTGVTVPEAAAVEPAPGASLVHPSDAPRNLDLILDVRVPITVQLGGAEMEIRDVLELSPGSIVALDKLAGEPVDVYVRGRRLAKGEVVVVDDNFGIRITTICSPDMRVSTLR